MIDPEDSGAAQATNAQLPQSQAAAAPSSAPATPVITTAQQESASPARPKPAPRTPSKPKAPAAKKTVAKPAAKKAVSPAAQPAAKPAAKVPAKEKAATPTPARKTVEKKVALPQVQVSKAPGKNDKVKAKLIRDSFTMPREDWDLIQQLKERALGFKRPTKKSELLRAGLQVMVGLSDAKLRVALEGLTPLKAGRPKGSGK